MKKVGSYMIEIKVEKIIGEDGESIFKANPNKISIGGMLASYVDKIHITIPDEWKGCAVRITFVPRYAVPVARLIDENGYLDITKDMTIRSRGSIVIDAQNGDYAAYSTDIEYTAYDHQRAGTASGKPSPNEYEQMISIAKSAVKSVNNVLPDQNGNVNVDAQQVQPDLNQNDSTAADYVKNRPFYTGNPVETEIIPATTVTFSEMEGLMAAAWPENFDLVDGQTYTISWDDTDYVCTGILFNNTPMLGNLGFIGAGENTGEPFLFLYQEGQWLVGSTESATEHVIGIKTVTIPIVQIDEKYLPKASEDNYGIIKTSDVVSVYNFPADAKHDQMVDAIAAFKTGNASIVWNGNKVIYASYKSSDDTISVAFSYEPLRTLTFSNRYGSYNSTLGEVTYGELQGSKVRIGNDDSVSTTLSVEGESYNVTLKTTAKRISIGGVYGMSTTEMILKSSTEGSNKNFKITVDDTGTISATEV